jgi:hypothetical protein
MRSGREGLPRIVASAFAPLTARLVRTEVEHHYDAIRSQTKHCKSIDERAATRNQTLLGASGDGTHAVSAREEVYRRDESEVAKKR